MRYFVRIGDEEHEVLLDADGVHIDGADVAAQVTAIDGTPVRMSAPVTIPGSAVRKTTLSDVRHRE